MGEALQSETWRAWAASAPLLPVLALGGGDDSLGVARALVAGGVRMIEIVLRLPGAIDALAAIVEAMPEIVVGAGTVTKPSQLKAVEAAGGRFVVSPGATPDLLDAMRNSGLSVLPGVSTISEALRAREAGCDAVKVFPAGLLGGPKFVDALASVFDDMHFCPTGGVGASEVGAYMAREQVFAFGASWPCTRELITDLRFDEITRRSQLMLQAARNPPTRNVAEVDPCTKNRSGTSS